MNLSQNWIKLLFQSYFPIHEFSWLFYTVQSLFPRVHQLIPLVPDRTSLLLHPLTPPACLCRVLIMGRKPAVRSGRWIPENALPRVCQGISPEPGPQGAIISQFRLIDLLHPGGHCLTWGSYLSLIEPSIPRRAGTTSCPMLNKECWVMIVLNIWSSRTNGYGWRWWRRWRWRGELIFY